MKTGLLLQYGVIAVLLVVAVVSLWRRLAPSKAGGCDSGCGSCGSGCKPVERIEVKTLDRVEAAGVEPSGHSCRP